jgi:mercuric ion transport protein
MYDTPYTAAHRVNTSNSSGALPVVLVGLAAAFCVASINALPMALTALGVSSSWVDGVGEAASPYRLMLLCVGVIGLAAGAVMLWFQQQAPYGSYAEAAAPPAKRALTFLGLVLGAALLLAGYACS